MSKYKHIISLGFFCSPASELERVGLRDASYPFDWLISDFKGVIECIENDFHDFLCYENMYQYKDYKHYYIDKRYNFHFYHDFSAYKDLKSQLPVVRQKYKRRIERFRQNIQEPTLFLRYVEGQNELDFIEENYEDIMFLLKSKNEGNDLILISNDDIVSNILEVFKVRKDEGDSVARSFFEKNAKLKDFMYSGIYDEKERLINRQKYKNKKRDEFLKKYINFVKTKIKSIFLKPYVHDSVEE